MASSQVTMSTAWQTRAAAGEPCSVIQVKSLTSTISGPHDAWGRPERPQPFSVSVELSLTRPFHGSSSGDVVDSDTVHYGLLSKEIQRLLDERRGEASSLATTLGGLWRGLLGWTLLGEVKTGSNEEAETEGKAAFLKSSSVRYLRLTVHLPKASLLGSGISLTAAAALSSAKVEARASTLQFHDLRVPSLIGVNSNERKAVQMVVANVDIDRWIEAADSYSQIAGVITNVSLLQLHLVFGQSKMDDIELTRILGSDLFLL